MKKKTFVLIGIVIMLLIGAIAYFKPLSFSDVANVNSKISMILNEYVITNGTPDIDVVEYKDITEAQKSAIFTVFEKYTYRRTFGTLFSNGSISGTGSKMLSIYMFGDDSDVIFVTSSEKIVINGKNYSMENAEQFIAQIVEIMERTA